MSEKIDSIFKGAGSALKSFADGISKAATQLDSRRVCGFLEDIEIKKSQYTTEKNVENIIAKKLLEEFGKVHQQYSIGGFLGLKVDIDLHDGEVGIEIKLAKELTTSGIERLFGQVLYYSRRTYKDNLIVLIVGREKEYNQVLSEIKDITEEIGVNFVYLNIKE